MTFFVKIFCRRNVFECPAALPVRKHNRRRYTTSHTLGYDAPARGPENEKIPFSSRSSSRDPVCIVRFLSFFRPRTEHGVGYGSCPMSGRRHETHNRSAARRPGPVDQNTSRTRIPLRLCAHSRHIHTPYVYMGMPDFKITKPRTSYD